MRLLFFLAGFSLLLVLFFFNPFNSVLRGEYHEDPGAEELGTGAGGPPPENLPDGTPLTDVPYSPPPPDGCMGVCTYGNLNGQAVWKDTGNPDCQNWCGAIQPGGDGDGGNKSPVGSHDGFEGLGFTGNSECQANGWATDPDDRGRDIKVRIYADGFFVTEATANIKRDDLGGQCNGGTCSFDVNLAGLISQGTQHSVRVKAVDFNNSAEYDLSSTPKNLTCFNAKVQGYKVMMPGNDPREPAASQTVSLTGETTNYCPGTSGASNPYCIYTAANTSHVVSTTVPANSTTGYTLCYNTTNCHSNTPTTGNAASVNITPSGGYADLWWHFTSPGPWYQTKDADVWAKGGDIRSLIPAGCTNPSCTPEFSLPGPGGSPGVPIASGTISFGSGTASAKGWTAISGYAGRSYSYSYFSNLAPSNVFTDTNSIISDSQISGGTLVSGYQSGGYIWRYRNGNLKINGTANLGDRKVILFVNGDLTVNGRITVTDGEGFFMIIVKGNILVDPSVSQPNQPALEGLFFSEGTFSTGTKNPQKDEQLYIRGSVAAMGGVNLQRDLDPGRTNEDNNTKPAELVEYAPDFIFTYPRDLSRQGLTWQEVAP